MRAEGLLIRAPAAAAVSRRRLPPALWALWLYLAGITVFGKGPTYLGFPPLYWGELTMLLVIAWALLRSSLGCVPPQRHQGLSLVVASFMALGLGLTGTSLMRWNLLDVGRDAAVWYYAVFYFLGHYVASIPAEADVLWQKLQRAWLMATAWVTLNLALDWTPALVSPSVPTRGVPVLLGSGSENVQHMFLGTVLVFLATDTVRRFKLHEGVMVLVAAAGVVMAYSFPGRGAKVAILTAVTVGLAGTLGTRRTLWPATRRLLAGVVLGLLLILVLVFKGVEHLWDTGHIERFTTQAGGNLWGTVAWRLTWWENIHAAVNEESALFGLGFGYDLAQLNPYLQPIDDPWEVRSPHNINVTIYGRMGWSGLLLWLGIVVMGLGRLFAHVRAGGLGGRRYTVERHKELTFWLILLVATWVNSSFGVLMEGPVLGIWFWFALGFASRRALGQDGLEPPVPT